MTSQTKGYLKKVLEARERLICIGSLHWVYLASGVFWFTTLAAIGWGADYALWHYFGQFVPQYEIDTSYVRFGLREGWIGTLFTSCGAVIFLTQYLRYLTTRIIVTSLRVISKAGWINIRIDGTDISDVRGVHVDQGWFGRFLNYGKIRLDCRFIDDVNIPFVKDPYKFTRNIQHMKSEIESHENTSAPMDTRQAHEAAHQTIIQINTGPSGAEIIQKDDHTLIVKPHEEPLSITHNLHDEILDDFKTKA